LDIFGSFFESSAHAHASNNERGELAMTEGK